MGDDSSTRSDDLMEDSDSESYYRSISSYYRSIVDTLKSVKRPGTYAAGGEVALPLPAISLTAEPNTILGLPLGEAQAKRLIQLASRAPYGKGEKTIVDTLVRCTWQLDPGQFSINNPRWEKSLQVLLDQVKFELGCDTKMKVAGELYKLLLYEPGGFFKRHRDTEKGEGMFGTLVIQLPSNYTGGKLIVYHQGKKSEFDYSGLDCCSNSYFTAFYADCQHEVKKVTEGYRLCLIYNLMYQGLDECPAPADNQKEVSTIVSAMKKWVKDIKSGGDCPDMMTYLLEHKYCEASLSFKFLKNGDRAVADVLIQAKAEVDFDLYMGIVNLSELWSADGGYYRRDDFIEEHICAQHLKASDSKNVVSQIDLHRNSFVPEKIFETVEPDHEELEEAMGNGGATLSKQYNWAALLLWPTRKRMAVKGVENMVELFKQEVDTGKKKKDLDNTAKDLMREMRYKHLLAEPYLTFLHALQVLADAKLIAEMLDVIAGVKYSFSLNDIIADTTFCSLLMSIAHKHGWDILRSPLQTMFGRCSSSNVEEYCAFLKRMITSKKPDDEKDLYKDLLSIIVKVLTEEDATPDSSSSSSWMYMSSKADRSKEFVSQLFSLLTAVGSDDLFATTVNALCNKPVRYPILETLGPAIVDFCKSTIVEKDGPLQEILSYCISQLKGSLCKVAVSNIKPVKFTCSCKDCVELKQFLRHPTQTQHQFRMSKGRRCHIRQQLDSSGPNFVYVTEHFGNPHTLVVTKTNTSCRRDIMKQEQKQALLSSLQPLLAVTSAPSEKQPPAKKQKANSKGVSGSSYIDLT